MLIILGFLILFLNFCAIYIALWLLSEEYYFPSLILIMGSGLICFSLMLILYRCSVT